MKRILVTGLNSYIGTSFEKWMNQYPEDYLIDSIDMRVGSWREADFSVFDVVFHVAGIAHVSQNEKLKDLYYAVNRDLTIDAAKKAKADGIKQFIFMSSIIVYGDGVDKSGIITIDTVPQPKGMYGDSKLQAEKGILALGDASFKVVVLRPPMVYGPGSKGNFPNLVKIAKFSPFFPDIDNRRSILYIDNLCEFVRSVINLDVEGIFYPQNAEYVSTSEIVKVIRSVNGRKTFMTTVFNPIIRFLFGEGRVNKVFGNLAYQQSMSKYEMFDYRVKTFKESVEYTKERSS
jgi:nucleoside-diphosphate-sugar epimerase